MIRVTLVVRGRVQGVGFRIFVLRRARDLGLSGRVSNRPDGSVEVRAEGERAALESLAEAVERVPAGSRVSGVESQWDEADPEFQGFGIEG